MRERSKLSDRQRSILRFMETYLERHGFPPTIREIGEATGINSTSVVNYNLNKLVSAGYLARSARASRGIRLVKGSTATAQGRKTAAVHNVQAAAKLARVPMVGQIVASEPVSIPEDMGYYYDEDSVIEVPPAMLNGADPSEVFALRVKGDSMIDAMIQDGDIVILRPVDQVKNGEMVAVYLPERGETTLKHYFLEKDGMVRLQPAHPTMDPIFVHASRCQVQGRVLSVLRMLR